MSVETYYGTITSTAVDYYAPRLREVVGLLVRHAPVTIDTTITDTDDEYAVILNVGSGRYAKLRAAKDGTSGIVEFSTGYKNAGYVALRGETHTYDVPQDENYQTILTIVNGGDVWELDYPIVYSSGYSTYRISFILRGSKVVSSIDGSEVWSSGVAGESITNPGIADYPLIDGLMFRYEDYEPQEYMLSCSDPDTAHNNVGEGKLMLFPSLLCAPGPFQTGAAMIGNQSTYFMSCRATDPIPRYEEFVLNRQRFVSLGRLAIRSR